MQINVIHLNQNDAHLTLRSRRHPQDYLFYLFFPPAGHGRRLIGELLLLLLLQATATAGANPRSWWTQVGPTAREMGGAGNRARDLPPHGQTAYHLCHQGRCTRSIPITYCGHS